MKIGVTGGAGFIGTQLCHLLEKNGHDFVILDIRASSAYPQRHVDVRNFAAVKEALAGCEVVYHLAAEHQDNVDPISLYYDVNVEGGKQVIKACEELGIEQIIFTSTVAIYGLDTADVSEEAEANPFNDYGRSKWESEKTFKEWAGKDEKHSLNILRPVATFGPGNRGNVYNLLRQLSSGKFVMVGRGENKKSLAYVGNIAAFLYFMMNNGAGVHIFNYADKPDMSMKEMIGIVRKTLGKSEQGLKLPYAAGLMGGYGFDVLAKLTGRTYPISAIRVKKFCSDTVVNADKVMRSGFMPPYVLQDGLRETIEAEFLNSAPSRADTSQSKAA
ncbi:MAG: NAD-dependent epimerase/dehydratase family protein [Micavibrio sp.]|nr:NAD-dependent epimerase/dehydratase family protein [Micavibrio sp.]